MSIPLRSMRVSAFAALVSALAVALGGAAKEIKDFHLGGPVVIKADLSSEVLRWGDLNHDGSLDFLTLNTRLNRVEIFIQTGHELKPFEESQWTIERSASDVLILDLNGDKRDDVLLAAKPCQVLLQDANGQFDERIDLDFEAKYLFTLQAEKGESAALLAVQNNQLALVRRKAGDALAFETETQPSGHAPLSRPLLIDLNADGLEDLAYLSASNKDLLVLRRRNADRRFNPERTFTIGFNSDFDAGRREDQATWLAAVEEKTNTAKVMTFKDKVTLSWEKFPFDDVQTLPFANTSSASKPQYLAADLNGDGFSELFRFDGESAELNRFRLDKNGTALFDRFPTLSGVNKARYAEYKQGRVRQLVCLSTGEEAFALIRENPDGKLGVPLIFDAQIKPLVFDLADLDGDGLADLITAAKAERPLRAHVATSNGDYVSTPALELEFAPQPATDDLLDLLAADFNRDGAIDLIFFYGFNPPQIYLQDPATKKFAALLTDDGMKRGLFNELRPQFFSLHDFDGDGRDELILLKKNYARVIAMDPAGVVTLLAQFNGEDSRSSLSGIVFEDLNGDKRDEVILLDRGNRQLTVYQADAPDQVFYSLKLEGADCLNLGAADVNGDGARDLIIENRESAGLLLRNVHPQYVSAISRRVTEIEDGKYARIRCLDFNRDGEDEVALMELKEKLLEFYQLDGDSGEWRRFYQFKVFQGEGPTLGYFKIDDNLTLPRQLEALDYNGDKLTDLVLLIHDNIILYPQLTEAK